jgi:L-lactate dehydrogenase complex protein LldG
MNTGKEAMLAAIRSALRDVPADERPEDVSVARDYRQYSDLSRKEIVEQFAERVAEYRATVWRVKQQELRRAITEACWRRGVQRLVVPPDLPWKWEPGGVELLRDEALTHEQLDRSDGVLTGCALGIAETGTIILDGGKAQGRRAITLLPDYHLCVVREEQIVALVPEAFARLGTTVQQEGRPITLISGPSATSDIELNRVEGVHGPRTLEVLIVETNRSYAVEEPMSL